MATVGRPDHDAGHDVGHDVGQDTGQGADAMLARWLSSAVAAR
ncbi:hypothetical protein [Parasedimentitalea maritima]